MAAAKQGSKNRNNGNAKGSNRRKNCKNANGYKLEVWVAKLFRHLGKPCVKRNVAYCIVPLLDYVPWNNNEANKNCASKRNHRKRVQIDVEYGLLKKTRIECKYIEQGLVQEDAVAEFSKKIELLGTGNYVMVTNSSYSSNAKQLAQQCGIKLLDGSDMEELHNSTLLSKFKGIVGIKEKSLEEQVKKAEQDYEHHYKKSYKLW